MVDYFKNDRERKMELLINHGLCGCLLCGLGKPDAGRLRWFGHVERKSGDDWVSACRNQMMVAGVRCAGRGRKTWRECARDDMEELGLHPEWVVFRDMWRDLVSGKTSDTS